MSELRYAEADGVHLAYRVDEGEGDRDVVLITPGGTIPMDALERDRVGRRLIVGLAGIGRLVRFDRRGIGLSDPIIDWDRPLVEQWADDLATIVDVADLDRPVVVSLGDYWGPARLFAGRNPAALRALVLYEPHGPEQTVDLRAGVAVIDRGAPGARRDGGDWLELVCASRAAEPAFREWFDMAGRTGASPAVAARLYEPPGGACLDGLRAAQQSITVPTLVLRRPANLFGSQPLPDPVVDAIAGSRRVDLPGLDYHWLGDDVDALLAEISRFVTGEAQVPAPERVLCAVLYTDIVGSTELALAHGDARWKAVLDRHDGIIRAEIERAGGTVVKTTGDGALATLPSGDRALRAASSIRGSLHREELRIRIGIHIGDIERRGDDVAGVAAHVGARVMSLANPGEILVTAPVLLAVMGTGHEFTTRGSHQLKGVAGEWELFALVDSAASIPDDRR